MYHLYEQWYILLYKKEITVKPRLRQQIACV